MTPPQVPQHLYAEVQEDSDKSAILFFLPHVYF